MEEDATRGAAGANTTGSGGEPPEKETERDKPLKRTALPTPEKLEPEAKEAPAIPSAVSLEDIPLPPHMKGPVSAPPPTPEEARAARGRREIGVEEKKTVVSIAKEKRTEIDENGLPRLRTYAADIGEAIRRKGATLSAIVGAERERAAAVKAPPAEDPAAARRRYALLAGAGALLIVGAGVIVGAFLLVSKGGQAPPVERSIIPENKKVRVSVGPATVPALLAEERAKATLSLGEIERIIVTDGGAELSPGALLTALGAPGQLARNARRVMVGIHAFDGNQPFVIIETAYYDLSFEAMLSWEKDMAESLWPFFAPKEATGPPLSLSFADAVFRNTDVRESVPVDGKSSMVYAFLADRRFLVVTTNKSTLTEILTRFSFVAGGR